MKIKKLTQSKTNDCLLYEYFVENTQVILHANDVKEYYICNNCGATFLDAESSDGNCPSCKSMDTSFEELTVAEIYEIEQLQD